ncbi:MAG TPA: serine hydrolase domain-containing protein [Terriglobales bacterium]|nr:serine hydrolase domain-containing protein [Terriglobales bacterium]
MKLATLACTSLLSACVAFTAVAQELPKANQPEEVGFSSERLKRLTSVVQADIDKGAIPGAVVLIARKGKVAYFEALGFQDRDRQIPMRTDTIFRLASMTKPFTSVAIMMLVEEGKIQLDDPVSVYLPEFKNVQVGVEKVDGITGQPELLLEPTRSQMTIQDLLRHTSGITYGFLGKSLVKQMYNDANVFDRTQTLQEFVSKLSRLPLAYQPGTTWDYGMSTDVLGRVVEVVSGMSFDQFIAERITRPLGLTDTGFYVTQGKVGRIAEPQVDAATGRRPPVPDVTKRPNFLSGGGGMVSTAADYARFCQMLLNGGELDGVRILSPSIVALMTSDHLPPGIAFDPFVVQNFKSMAPMPDRGRGFGLGFAVRTHPGRSSLPGSPGLFYWGGLWGTVFWVDPKEELLAVWMVQVPAAQGGHYRSLIRTLVYQALLN